MCFPVVFFFLFRMSWKTPKYIEAGVVLTMAPCLRPCSQVSSIADCSLRCCQLHVWHSGYFPPCILAILKVLLVIFPLWKTIEFVVVLFFVTYSKHDVHFKLCISHFKSFLTTLYYGLQAFFLLFTQFAGFVLCLTTGTFSHCCKWLFRAVSSS